MNLTTITLPAVEMTNEEENDLWNQAMKHGHEGGPKPTIGGMTVEDWATNDGANSILFEGEKRYRQIIRPENQS